MKILYIDIDTLRPDHLGCYGYHRNTSPNIDWIASQGSRYDNCYVSDAPCLPSRAALYSGRCGFQNGAINHGGVAADMIHEGPTRKFRDRMELTGWIPQLRKAGLRTVSVSPFGERHSAWWWYAGWNEVHNPGMRGMELADSVTPLALDWIKRNAATDNWFLHVNYWDPHTPYRTPLEFGNHFENDPIPEWLTEDVRKCLWNGFGPHSAQEPHHELDGNSMAQRYPRVPAKIDSMEAVKKWIDGYDMGVWYADRHVGFLLEALKQQGVLDETVIMLSSDHGENLGELNVWGDHQTADHITSRVPLIVKWPGLGQIPKVYKSLHYQFDWAATLLELLGQKVPNNWDGRSFASDFIKMEDQGREYLVLSQAAWSCQRSVRFNLNNVEYICMQTYHDGYKELSPVMLFNLSQDPHECTNLVDIRPDITNKGLSLLSEWHQNQMLLSSSNIDPMMTVLREGGPFHTKGTLSGYIDHLTKTGRGQHAARLKKIHPNE